MNRILKFCVLLLLNVVGLNTVNARHLVVGYYRSWAQKTYSAENINYGNLTHINHAFIWPRKDGSLEIPPNFLYPQLIKTAHQHDVKVVVSLGGWGHGYGFRPMTSHPNRRKRFIREITDFCVKYDYDGVDLDWEYPTARDRKNFSALVRELRRALTKADSSLSLSVALPSQDRRMGFDPKVLQENMDWIGIMTYDYHGSWSRHSGHQAPLYSSPEDSCGSLSSSIQFWLNQGIKPQQLAAGLSFFGRMFTTESFYQPSSGGDAFSYTDAESLQNDGWTYAWDSVATTPYLQNKSKTQILSFDDSTSVAAKCDYILEQNVGGAIIWALGHDYSTEVNQPLLKVVGSKLLTPQ